MAYFPFCAKLTYNARNASILQPRKGKVSELAEKGGYVIFGRDLSWTNDKLTMRCHTKQSRLAGTVKKPTFSFPRPEESFKNLKFVGPYWTYWFLDRILKREEKFKYFTRPLWSGFHRRPMDAEYVGDWMRKVRRNSPALQKMLKNAPMNYKWNPSTIRSQTITIMERIAENPRELMSPTHHMSARTAIEHYVKVSEPRKRELRLEVHKHFTGMLSSCSPPRRSLTARRRAKRGDISL